jgi:hypothetical protein
MLTHQNLEARVGIEPTHKAFARGDLVMLATDKATPVFEARIGGLRMPLPYLQFGDTGCMQRLFLLSPDRVGQSKVQWTAENGWVGY